MPESTLTVEGLEELRAGVAVLPPTVTDALRTVAERIARRGMENARMNLSSRTNGHGNTAAALTIREDRAGKRFLVGFGLILNRPSNLPLWLEFGFKLRNGRMQPGIYFMRDAARGLDAPYREDMEAAAIRAFREAIPEAA